MYLCDFIRTKTLPSRAKLNITGAVSAIGEVLK